jgi:hypothetical protein
VTPHSDASFGKIVAASPSSASQLPWPVRSSIATLQKCRAGQSRTSSQGAAQCASTQPGERTHARPPHTSRLEHVRAHCCATHRSPAIHPRSQARERGARHARTMSTASPRRTPASSVPRKSKRPQTSVEAQVSEVVQRRAHARSPVGRATHNPDAHSKGERHGAPSRWRSSREQAKVLDTTTNAALAAALEKVTPVLKTFRKARPSRERL